MSSLSSRLTSKGLQVSPPTTSGGTTGGTVNVSGSAVTLDTVASLNAATIDITVNYIRVAGYHRVGDPGSGAYRRKAVSESDVAGDQTSDGGTVRWEIIPENNRLKLHNFGCQGMINYLVQPAPGDIDDSYRFMVLADKYIFQKNLGGITLDIGPELIYFSKAHNMKRKAYKIQGNATNQGTMIRCPAYEDVFMINYNYGNGHDSCIYINNFGVGAGQSMYKQLGKSGEGNIYRCIVSGTTAVSGDTLSGSDPNATYTDGTCQFKFEKYIGPNGTNPYDYYLDTDRSAGTSEIADMQFWSFWDNASSDPNINKWPDQHGLVGTTSMVGLYNCAIVERVRAKLINIFAFQFPGFGVGIAADGDPCLTGPGNVNGFHNDHLFCYYHGKSGLHIGYADANAGETVYLDTSFCGRYGYEEWSFLGNMMSMHQSAFDGNIQLARKQYPSGALHNGYGWIPRLPILGIDNWPNYINEEPGGSNNAWIRYWGDGTVAAGTGGANYPDWNATQKYEPGGGFGTNNINARNVLVSIYIEGGTMPSQPCANDVVLSGLIQDVDSSRGALILGNNNWSFLSTNSINMDAQDGATISMKGTNGIPTGQGGDHELRINRAGNSGTPWAYQYYNSAWNAVGGNRP